MRLNTLEKLYECLKNESPEYTGSPEIAGEGSEAYSADAGDFGEAGIMIGYTNGTFQHTGWYRLMYGVYHSVYPDGTVL